MSAVRPPPSALSHKRTLSSLNRPSPNGQSPLASASSPVTSTVPTAGPTAAGDSPERTAKRARFDAPSGNAVAKGSSAVSVGGGNVPSPTPASHFKDSSSRAEASGSSSKGPLNKGAEWVLKQVDVMEGLYRDAVRAAVLIVQHQKYSQELGITPARIPLHLARAVQHAWSSYQATRRHIEHYIQQSAIQASTPSRPVTVPSPRAAAASQLTPLPAQPQLGASPVPLAASSIMGFDTDDPAKLAQLVNGPPPIQGLDGLNFVPDASIPGQAGLAGLDDLNNGGQGGGGAMDLGEMGMAELSAMINGDSYTFGSSGIPSQAVDLNPTGDSGTKGEMTGMTPGTAAETERILAEFGAMTNTQGNTANAAVQSASASAGTGVAAGQAGVTGPGELDMSGDMMDFSTFDFSQMADLSGAGDMGATGDAAGGGTGDGRGGNGSGGMGDMDLGNLSELAGLFDSNGPSQAATANASPSQNQATFVTDNGNAGQGPSQAEQNTAPDASAQTAQGQTLAFSQPEPLQATVPPAQPDADFAQQPATSDSAVNDQGVTATTIPSQAQPEAPAQPQNTQPATATMPQPAQVQAQPMALPLNLAGMDTSATFDALGLQGFGGFQPDGGMMGGGGEEMDGINMDDFDFGDSGLPNVEGDEFESLFAEFK